MFRLRKPGVARGRRGGGPGLRAGGARGYPGAWQAAGKAGRQAASLGPGAPPPAGNRPTARSALAAAKRTTRGCALRPRTAGVAANFIAYPPQIMPAPGAAGGCAWYRLHAQWWEEKMSDPARDEHRRVRHAGPVQISARGRELGEDRGDTAQIPGWGRGLAAETGEGRQDSGADMGEEDTWGRYRGDTWSGYRRRGRQ